MPDPRHRRRRNTVLSVLELSRRTHPALSIMALRALLYVAENPGLNNAELAQACRVSEATTSRTVRLLSYGDPDRGITGMNLVSVAPHPADPRMLCVTLSGAGQRFCAEIDRLIQSCIPISHPAFS